MSTISKRKVHTGQCILSLKQIDAMLANIDSKECNECSNTSVYCGLCGNLLNKMMGYRVTKSYTHRAKLFCGNIRRNEFITTIFNDSEERALATWEGY